MDFDYSSLAFFALFPLIIIIVLVVHELGHFWAARLFGFPVKSVVIGAGRSLWEHKDKHGISWQFRLFPVKAHVDIEGFDDEAKPLWKRFLAILAGPVINLIFPFFLFFIFFILIGQPSTPPVLTGIEVGEVAEESGLRPGDRFIAVDGIPVYSYNDIKRFGYRPEAKSTYTIKRGEEVFDVTIQPRTFTYMDIEGIERTVYRLGVIWRHKAFSFEAVNSLNGVEVDKDNDKIRSILVENIGRDILFGLNSTDGEVHTYRAHLHQESNPHINTPDHEDYERVFLGKTRDDFYERLSPSVGLFEAGRFNVELIGKVATLPFQLFPLDKYILVPTYAVTDDQTWLANKVYRFIYILALSSLLVAYINFLPLPYLDGSYLVFYALEAATGKKPGKRLRARVLAFLFFVFYMAVMFANLDNIPRYIDSRVKKLQEFVDK